MANKKKIKENKKPKKKPEIKEEIKKEREETGLEKQTSDKVIDEEKIAQFLESTLSTPVLEKIATAQQIETPEWGIAEDSSRKEPARDYTLLEEGVEKDYKSSAIQEGVVEPSAIKFERVDIATVGRAPRDIARRDVHLFNPEETRTSSREDYNLVEFEENFKAGTIGTEVGRKYKPRHQ